MIPGHQPTDVRKDAVTSIPTPAASQTAHVLHPADLPSVERGPAVHTAPLVGAPVGAVDFLSGITTFAPGGALAPHRHNCPESVTVLRGDAIAEIAGQEYRLTPLDTTYVPANVVHRFRNGSPTTELQILWTYGSPDATRTSADGGTTTRIDEEGPLGRAPATTWDVYAIDIDASQIDELAAALRERSSLLQRTDGTLSLELHHEDPSAARAYVVVTSRSPAGLASGTRDDDAVRQVLDDLIAAGFAVSNHERTRLVARYF